MGALLKLIICITAAIFAFRINMSYGLIVVILSLVYLYFSNYSNLMVEKANTEYKLKNYDNALAFYEKALKRGRPTFITLAGYALMLLRCGKPDEALEKINDILSTPNLPQNIKTQSKQIRALINYKLTNFDEAYEEAMEIYDDGYQTSNMRGLIGLLMLSSSKPLDETLAFCEDAYDYDADNKDIVDNYLIALTESGRLDEAKEISEELTELAPDFAETYYHSALLYKKLGDINKAKDLLNKLCECEFNYMTTISESEIEALKNSLERTGK